MGLGGRRRLAEPLGFLSGQRRRRSLDGERRRVTGARSARPHVSTCPASRLGTLTHCHSSTPTSPHPTQHSLNVGLPRPPKAPFERAAKEAKLVGRPKGSVGEKGMVRALGSQLQAATKN